MSLEKIVADLVQKVERRFYGKYRGFVVDNADPEKLGRLKLQVPSVLGQDVVTGWALPCLPYGGDVNQGFLFIPEKKAGVWVEFEEGDLEFPIWTGTFWSKPGGDSELPKPNDNQGVEDSSPQDPPTRKIIKTKKGHTLQFEDAEGKEMVTLLDGKNKHVIALDKQGISIKDGVNNHIIALAGDGITLTDGINHHSIVMNKKGITLTDGVNKHTITFGQSAVTIASNSDVTITGTNIKITATCDLTAKGTKIYLNP